MPQAKDFYSKSVAEAIRQACAEFSTSQEKLDIEVLETGSAGIFGLCRKRAHIRARLKKGKAVSSGAPEAPASPAAEKEVSKSEDVGGEEAGAKTRPEKKRSPARKKAPAAAVEEQVEDNRPPQEPPSAEALEAIRAVLLELVQRMGMESEVTVDFSGGNVLCRISGQFEQEIIGPEGRTLDNLQYLIRKMMSRTLPDKMSVDLDAGDFRERREEELKKIAVELAEQVKEDGKTQSIQALNPSERRVVHVTLQDDKGVRSRSVGDGLFKKVLIYKPGKSRKSGSRRRGRQGGGKPSEE